VLADQNKDTLLAAISAARNDQLLPEAYLWGFGHAYVESRERRSFLNGDYSYSGWWYFFPYSFGVKTPLATFAVLALALAAGVVTVLKAPPGDSGQPAKPSQRLTRALYRIAPLLVLLVVYWAFAIRSHINIGHRHLLPVYPALFILAGAVGHWLKTRSRIMQYLVFAAFVLVAMETYRIWPYFLAYFNQSIGGPTTAYEHMVDSSLDWGQELPRLKMWLEAKSLSQDRDPVYFSYFGSSRQPEYYGIRAIRLVSFGPPPNRPMLPVLRGGTYCFSATMLETVPVQYWGRWNSWLEKRYQETRKKRFQGTSKSLEEYVGKVDRSMNLPQEFLADVEDLDQLRFCRLAAYLRQQRPMASIGHSILIFRLTDEQAEQALYGPPVELAGQPKP
jgi:hypothetical protein